MKHICITYHMKNGEEHAETCITLPMREEIAEAVLRNGADSVEEVQQILTGLATIQGYTYCGSNHSEWDAKWKEIDKHMKRIHTYMEGK